MNTEVVVAIIVAISTIIVAFIQYRTGIFTKRKSDDKKQSMSLEQQIANDPVIVELRNKKKAAFDDREETYNELTLCLARHIIVHDPDSEDIQKNLDRCLKEDINYRNATNNFLDEINRIMDNRNR